MAEKKKAAKKYKRIVYCERCGHPADRHDSDGDKHYGCQAKTIKPGAPQCKCPHMAYPIPGGYMTTMGQRATQEDARAGRMPPPFEPPEKAKGRTR